MHIHCLIIGLSTFQHTSDSLIILRLFFWAHPLHLSHKQEKKFTTALGN